MRRLTGDSILSERIVQDYRRAGLDEKTRAMLDYSIKITRTPVDCDEADIDKLQALGFSLDDVYDIITTASMYNYNNRVAEAAGHLPDRANHGLFGRARPLRGLPTYLVACTTEVYAELLRVLELSGATR